MDDLVAYHEIDLDPQEQYADNPAMMEKIIRLQQLDIRPAITVYKDELE